MTNVFFPVAAIAVYDVDVLAERDMVGNHKFRRFRARHSRHAEFGVQRRGVRATVSVHRHRMGILPQSQPIR